MVKIKKTIAVHGRHLDLIQKLNEQISLNAHADWRICNPKEVPDVELCIDAYPKLKSNHQAKTFICLLRLEPPIVLPQNYSNSFERLFNGIIEIGKSPSSNLHVLNWPQNIPRNFKFPMNDRPNRIVAINSNLLSFFKNENYSMRRYFYSRFSQLDVYGKGWDISFFRKVKTTLIEALRSLSNYERLYVKGIRKYYSNDFPVLGEIESKTRILSRYRFCLVIENDASYLSEKIFDAFLSGCVPIYFGPELTSFGIDDSLYISIKKHDFDVNKIEETLTNFDFFSWQVKTKAWLESSQTYNDWSIDTFSSRLLRKINTLIHQ